MHIHHLPKPLHGWRAFLGEVGIIVLGVLIALGAESAVEAVALDIYKVDVIRASLMGELANDRARWENDIAFVGCARADVHRLQACSSRAGGDGAGPTARNIRPNGLFWMHSANWTLATGSQTLDHFPIDEQLTFAALYDGVVHRQIDLEQRASGLTERVQTLIPLATDAQGRRELRVALGDLENSLHVLVANDAYMKRHFNALGVKPDRRDIAADLAFTRCVP